MRSLHVRMCRNKNAASDSNEDADARLVGADDRVP